MKKNTEDEDEDERIKSSKYQDKIHRAIAFVLVCSFVGLGTLTVVKATFAQLVEPGLVPPSEMPPIQIPGMPAVGPIVKTPDLSKILNPGETNKQLLKAYEENLNKNGTTTTTTPPKEEIVQNPNNTSLQPQIKPAQQQPAIPMYQQNNQPNPKDITKGFIEAKQLALSKLNVIPERKDGSPSPIGDYWNKPDEESLAPTGTIQMEATSQTSTGIVQKTTQTVTIPPPVPVTVPLPVPPVPVTIPPVPVQMQSTITGNGEEDSNGPKDNTGTTTTTTTTTPTPTPTPTTTTTEPRIFKEADSKPFTAGVTANTPDAGSGAPNANPSVPPSSSSNSSGDEDNNDDNKAKPSGANEETVSQSPKERTTTTDTTPSNTDDNPGAKGKGSEPASNDDIPNRSNQPESTQPASTGSGLPTGLLSALMSQFVWPILLAIVGGLGAIAAAIASRRMKKIAKKEESFACSYCDIKFPTQEAVNEHIKNYHNKETESSGDKIS